MFNIKKAILFLTIFALLALVLVGCQPETIEVTRVVEQEVTRVVTETIVEEGQEVEVTRVVTEVVEVETEEETVVMTDSTPDTLVKSTFSDVDTMDPALAYDTASGEILENVMETLIYFNFKDGTTYVPVLATEVPSVENGGISEDGLTYTFNIRKGVTFHKGGTLEPHDVAYSFQRGLLQSDPNGPQWLLLEPILGYSNCLDITEGIEPECGLTGDPEALATADPAAMVAVCKLVQEAIVADDEAGTVTMIMNRPWGPFLAIISAYWGSILDMEWAIETGAWDGSCDTWQKWYAPGSENSELTSVINGTGPYKLDHWTPGEERVLVANENYWRTDDMPIWEGGPAGVPAIRNIVIQSVSEWGTRFAAFQAGDAEFVTVNAENRPQFDEFVGEECDWRTNECTPTDNPDGPFRAFRDLPSVSKSHVFMTWQIAEDSPFIGSGQLDGNGIPPDFFSDEHVRKAMAACFDYETFISEAQNGEGVRTNGPIILDMLGYNNDGPMHEYDPELCAAELEQAWDGVLPETGFRFSVGFNTGNLGRQTAAQILQSELRKISPNYQVDIVGMPWPTFLRSFRETQLPMFTSGWREDIHDPHNWAQPFTVGVYGGRQGLPQEILDKYTEWVNAGVAASEPSEREAAYFEMQQAFYEDVISLPLSQQTGTHYEQRWVTDWFNRVGRSGDYFYAYGLEG